MPDLTIWKYPLVIDDSQTLDLPVGARVLSVQFQREILWCWALVDPHASIRPRVICMYGTGHPVPVVHGRFIGTVQQFNGNLVWHVFEEVG